MKDYVIWLDSGECLIGTVDEKNERMILKSFVKRNFRLMSYEDTEGTACVDISKIQAIIEEVKG